MQNRMNFPETIKVYGIVVRETTAAEDIRSDLLHLGSMDADLVVFLSVDPHDVKARDEWPSIKASIRVREYRGDKYQAWQVKESDLPSIAEDMSVIRRRTGV